MSEANLWKYLARTLGGMWEAQRHEDKHSIGIPDLSYATDHHGWIELKKISCPSLVKPIKIAHFTPAQKSWVKRFGAKCGHVWVLIQIDRRYLLFGWWSVDQIGKLTLNELSREAHQYWDEAIDPEEFMSALSRVRPLSSNK